MPQDLHTQFPFTFSSVGPFQDIITTFFTVISQTLSMFLIHHALLLLLVFLTSRWDCFHICWHSSYHNNPALPVPATSAIRSLSHSLIPTVNCICLFPHIMHNVIILVIFHSSYLVIWISYSTSCFLYNFIVIYRYIYCP